jgi:hypothetical protein
MIIAAGLLLPALPTRAPARAAADRPPAPQRPSPAAAAVPPALRPAADLAVLLVGDSRLRAAEASADPGVADRVVVLDADALHPYGGSPLGRRGAVGSVALQRYDVLGGEPRHR